jgi:hypothetical protein
MTATARDDRITSKRARIYDANAFGRWLGVPLRVFAPHRGPTKGFTRGMVFPTSPPNVSIHWAPGVVAEIRLHMTNTVCVPITCIMAAAAEITHPCQLLYFDSRYHGTFIIYEVPD